MAMEGANYWKRWAERRLSRRRLLAGAAGAGTGLAALSLVGCGGGEKAAPSASAGASPAGTPAASPIGSPAATPPGNVFYRWGSGPRPALEPARTRGGIQRWFGFEAITLDTFDPHQSQFGPASHPQSTIFSKVLKYWDVYAGQIVPDLAEAMPESPDKLTYVIKIRPGVRFHNTEKIRQQFPQVAGRELTAEDVKYSIERQLNTESPRSSLYYRRSQWETIDKIELVAKRPTCGWTAKIRPSRVAPRRVEAAPKRDQEPPRDTNSTR